MKIAYFSPFNPVKSGISDYSEYLVNVLRDKVTVDLWVSGFKPSNLESNFQIFDYVEHPHLLGKLSEYDFVLYNIGNNPYYHANMYDVFLKYNGYVILHDLVLYYLVVGYYLELINDKDMLINEAYYNGQIECRDMMQDILSSNLPALQYKEPEKLPLNKRLINHAKGIIVHSEYAKNQILTINPQADCWVIPQIGPNEKTELSTIEVLDLKKKYGIDHDELVVASFGFIAESKRIHQVLAAFSRMNYNKVKYLLVGEGDYIDNVIKKYGMESFVIKTGFTTIDEFDKLIKLSDIVINLRYPYMGETSASLIRALLFGKPSLATNVGWFAELPDDTIIKINYDNNEINNLMKQLEKLISDKDLRERFSINATKYADEYLNTDKIVDSILYFISESENKIKTRNFDYEYCDSVANQLMSMGVKNTDQFYIDAIAKKIYSIL